MDLIRRLLDQLHSNEVDVAREYSGGRTEELSKLNRGEASAAIDELKSEAGWD